jgi:hypothetical protein
VVLLVDVFLVAIGLRVVVVVVVAVDDVTKPATAGLLALVTSTFSLTGASSKNGRKYFACKYKK